MVEGRADGVIEEEGHVCVDEIKGIYQDVNLMEKPIGVHLAQAKCYAYILSVQRDLPEISVQMTYCNLDTVSGNLFFPRAWGMVWGLGYGLWKVGGFPISGERRAECLYHRFGIPFPLPGRAKKAGGGCVPHSPPWEKFVYPGAYRDRENNYHCFSGC